MVALDFPRRKATLSKLISLSFLELSNFNIRKVLEDLMIGLKTGMKTCFGRISLCAYNLGSGVFL